MNTKSGLESVDKGIKNVFLDPCTNAGKGFLDALKQPLNGKLPILIGCILPPFNDIRPRLLDKADDRSTDTAQSRTDGLYRAADNSAPVDAREELSDVIAKGPPVEILNGRTERVQQPLDVGGQGFTSLAPVDCCKGIRKGSTDCCTEAAPVEVGNNTV